MNVDMYSNGFKKLRAQNTWGFEGSPMPGHDIQYCPERNVQNQKFFWGQRRRLERQVAGKQMFLD